MAKVTVKTRRKKAKKPNGKGRQMHMGEVRRNHVPEPVERLRLRLSSPRLKSARTLKDYTESATSFLQWLGSDGPPTDIELMRYFEYRRSRDISERTLRKEYFHIKKLCEANKWTWPFEKEDAPVSMDEAHQPAHTLDDIKKLVAARDVYTRPECFYLMVSTTWGCRRTELARIKKRDWDANTIIIHIAKQKSGDNVRKKHLLPETLKPVFGIFHPTVQTTTGLSYMYHRICDKAGVRNETGWGFHCIRRSVETFVRYALVKNDLPESWIADWMGWAKTTKGDLFANASMSGVYDHPEILDNDPWYQEKLIIKFHPFIPLWEGELPKAFTVEEE